MTAHLVPPEVVAELKAKYEGRDLLLLRSQSVTAVAVVPDFAQAREYEAIRTDKARIHTRHEWVARNCVVFPPKDELDALLHHKPALCEAWMPSILDAAGFSDVVKVSPDVPSEHVTAYQGRTLVRLDSFDKAGEGAKQTGSVVAKVPNLPEMREVRRRLHGPTSHEVPDWLSRSCIVSPSTPEEINAMLHRRPFLIECWFNALCNEAGGSEKVEVGKL